MPAPDAVEQLIDMLAPNEPTAHQVDWAAIETSLGVPLPSDFKAFVERVPHGRFGNKLVPNYLGRAENPPNDFLAPVAHIVDTYIRRRAEDSGVFPHPLFPEPGGLLIWATGAERIFFWLTKLEDPDQWPVVCSNRQFTQWDTFLGGMAEFVLDEMRADRLPPFQPYSSPAPRAFTPRKDNETPRWPTAHAPVDQAHVLIAAIDPPTAWAQNHDWDPIEARLGVRLPADYKTFIDTCGPGQLCDLDIYGPGTCRSHDMFILQAKQTAAAARIGLSSHLSFHPATKGLLCWGIAPDGTYLNWKTTAEDPQEWSVATFNPRRQTAGYYDDMSLSTFLLRYSGVSTPSVTITGNPWTTRITFNRHECS